MTGKIIINNAEVPIKSNLYVMIRYKAAFGKDLFFDVQLAIAFVNKCIHMAKTEEHQNNPIEYMKAYSKGLELVPRIAWVLAKEANDSLPEFEEWAKSIESLDIIKICETTSSLIMSTIKCDPKNE